MIPSFPWIVPPRPPTRRNPRKGRDQISPSGNTADFRQFSVVTLTFIPDEGDDIKPGATASIEAVEVTSEVEPDSELAAALEKYTDKMETEMIKELGEFKVDLDGRFSSVRTRDTVARCRLPAF